MRLRGPTCNNTTIPERLVFTHYWFFATTSATTDDVLDGVNQNVSVVTHHTYTCMKKYYNM